MTPLQAKIQGQEIFSDNVVRMIGFIDKAIVEEYARDPNRPYCDIHMENSGYAGLLSPNNAYVAAIQQHYGEQGWTVRFTSLANRKFTFQPKKG